MANRKGTGMLGTSCLGTSTGLHSQHEARFSILLHTRYAHTPTQLVLPGFTWSLEKPYIFSMDGPVCSH